MSYCETCKKKYKVGYATSQKHLDSNVHKNNLKKSVKRIRSEKGISVNPIHELILFNILQNQDGVKYSGILKFFSSFGIKGEVALRTLIKKLKDEDIVYKGNIGSDYEEILKKIIQIPKMDYPLTLSIKEAYEKFHFLGFKFPIKLMDHFNKLANKYPGFISLSSSKIGDPSDLITFKEIFIDRIRFHKNNNWGMK